jgi:hypothetical protein
MEPLATVRNATEAAKRFASSEAGQLARIEGLVVVCCLLSSILVLGNSRRRHESRWFPRLVVWATFLFNYPVVAYTIGAMQSSSIQNELFVVWACFLILLLGSADCMTAFSFDDSSQQTRSMMNQGLHIVYPAAAHPQLQRSAWSHPPCQLDSALGLEHPAVGLEGLGLPVNKSVPWTDP